MTEDLRIHEFHPRVDFPGLCTACGRHRLSSLHPRDRARRDGFERRYDALLAPKPTEPPVHGALR